MLSADNSASAAGCYHTVARGDFPAARSTSFGSASSDCWSVLLPAHGVPFQRPDAADQLLTDSIEAVGRWLTLLFGWFFRTIHGHGSIPIPGVTAQGPAAPSPAGTPRSRWRSGQRWMLSADNNLWSLPDGTTPLRSEASRPGRNPSGALASNRRLAMVARGIEALRLDPGRREADPLRGVLVDLVARPHCLPLSQQIACAADKKGHPQRPGWSAVRLVVRASVWPRSASKRG